MSIAICAECKHHSFKGPIWYSQYCAFKMRKTGIDPVTGNTQYVREDGGLCDDPYPYCRSMNKGSCRNFERTVGLLQAIFHNKEMEDDS